MATIETMTDEGTEPAPAVPAADDPQPASPVRGHDASNRRLLVPVLSAVICALIAGVFVLAALGFNTLRSDIKQLRSDMTAELSGVHGEIGTLRGDLGTLRSDMRTEIVSLREEIRTLRNDMNRGFEAINEVLLDHTDRLVRLDTATQLRHEAGSGTAE